MALNKTTVVDRIEVLEMGQIQVRTATVIDEDGVELSRKFHRHVLEPGADLTEQTERVTGIANATWTAQVVSDWEAFVASLEA
jgi:hypothetical protein